MNLNIFTKEPDTCLNILPKKPDMKFGRNRFILRDSSIVLVPVLRAKIVVESFIRFIKGSSSLMYLITIGANFFFQLFAIARDFTERPSDCDNILVKNFIINIQLIRVFRGKTDLINTVSF